MKAAAWLACTIVILALASPALGTSLRLDKVMDGRVPQVGAEVRGAGGYYGDCIRVDIVNDSGQPVTIDVPLGLLLVPDRGNVQTMVCSGAERLDAGPGRTTHRIKAFCGEEHDSAPGTGTAFTNGGRASGELLKRLREILRDGRFDPSTQRLVWNISQSLDLSKGAGPSPAEKKATGAAALTTLILLIWQIANGLVKVPGGGLPAPQVPAPADEGPAEPAGDRPSWSLMNRKENDIYDAANERWVDRDSERAREMFMDKRREMSRKGYDYDDEQDAFVQRGLEYDEKGDAFRRSIPERGKFEVDAEKGDAARIKLGPGFLVPGDEWMYSRGPQTREQYREVYKPLEDRLRYLDEREDDIKHEHESALRAEKKAREIGDEWLAEQWRKRAEETKEDVGRVQEQKLDLTRRVDEHSRDAETWAEQQKKSWTVGKVVKEVGSTLVPDPEDLRPLFEQTVKLRNRLQKAIDDDPGKLVLPKDPSKIDPALERIRGQSRIFKDVDETMARIKTTAAALKEARDIGDGKAAKALSRELEAVRGRLSDLNAEMQNIHKLSAQWQAGSHALTGTSALTTMQYYGQTKMAVDVGKAGAQFLKPRLGSRAPRMLDEKGNIIGKPEQPKPGAHVADGSAASPEDFSRKQNYEFFAVKKDGSVRAINQTGGVDAAAEKGELIIIRDKASGGISKHKFYGEGAGERPMHRSQKDLLWKKAQEAFGGGEGRAEAAGAGGSSAGGGGETGGGAGAGGASGGPEGRVAGGSGEGRGGGGEAKGTGTTRQEPSGGAAMSESADSDGTPLATSDAKPAPANRPDKPPVDLKKLVPERESLKTPKARENAEKLFRGEEPDFSGAKGHEDTAAAWEEQDWIQKRAANKAGKEFQNPGERLEYWKQQDPHFKQMDEIFTKAQIEARQRMIQEIQPEIVEQMKQDGWTPGQPGFEGELSKRIGSDLRIHTGKKVQEYYYDNLFKQKPDLEPFDERWYLNKSYEYRNTPIPDQPEAPVRPSPSEAPASPPVESPEPPAGPPPGKTVVPPSPGRPTPDLGDVPAGKTAAGPAQAGPPDEGPAPSAPPAVPATPAPAAPASPAVPAQPAVQPPAVGPADVPSVGPALDGAGDLGSISMKEAGGLEGLGLGSRGLESAELRSAGLENAGLGGAADLRSTSTLGQAAGGLEPGSSIQRDSLSFARMLESVFGKKE